MAVLVAVLVLRVGVALGVLRITRQGLALREGGKLDFRGGWGGGLPPSNIIRLAGKFGKLGFYG